MKNVKSTSEWRNLRTFYHRFPDGTVEATIWDAKREEPVWTEVFKDMATARAVAEQERSDIAAYRRELKGKGHGTA